MKFTVIFLISLLVSSSFAINVSRKSKAEATSCAAGLTVDPVFVDNGKYYIRLAKTGAGDNFSGYKVPANKPWGASDSDVKTVWQALQIDLNNMLIHTGDFTYSQSTGQCSHHAENKNSVPFGSAFGCSNTLDSVARIDLTGTPFAIDDTFAAGGWQPQGSAVFSSNNQIVDIRGGGYCGWEVPSKANAAGESKAAVGGWFLKVKFLDCLNGVATIGCNGGFYVKVNSAYSSYKVPTRKPWSASDSDVKTIFNKIRLNPANWLVDTGDFTYAKSSGYCSHNKANNPDRMPLGSAFGCESPSNADANAKIDLTGTPFAIDDTFTVGGYLPGGAATFSSNNQIVDITGGGYCGWNVPTKANAAGEDAAHRGGWYLKLKPQ
jgi:hypothetical protein